MLRQLAEQAPIERIALPEWQQAGVDVLLWRLDRIEPAGCGNKLFKLAENLQRAKAEGYTRILSFGGVFSNHIHALALHGATQGFETIGVIRGEPEAADNPTLSDARRAGMHLHFVDRTTYRQAHQASLSERWFAQLQRQFGPCYIIPEGGANVAGVLGCRVLGEVIAAQCVKPDVVVVACGTGSTLAGVVAGTDGCASVLGVAVLKGGDFLDENVRGFLREVGAGNSTRWAIDTEHHCGGYARVTPALQCFIDRFTGLTDIPVEPIYTGKMLYAIDRRIERGDFARDTRVLAIHTGGLQGARGFSYRYNTNNKPQWVGADS